MSKLSIPQKKISDTLTISRVLTGLWQVADMERSGEDLDPDQAANQLSAYVRDGFSTFDMADHYGSAEIIAGRMLKRF
ncbi:MAG: aldo/keto reductase, partial [Paracoccaceae bacterium]